MRSFGDNDDDVARSSYCFFVVLVVNVVGDAVGR